MKDLVSVVVPVYNCEKYIKETIDTIKNQTYKNIEAIFVDDCSTDNSLQILKENISDNMKIIQLEKNAGVANARNEGIKTAKGKYLAFLDSDDLWEEDKIEKQVEFMKEKDCVFSFSGYEFVKEDKTKTGKIAQVPEEITYRQALKNTTIFTSTVMINLSKVKKEDIYMPNIPSEDTATWWNILKKYGKAYGLNETLAYYRRHEESLSSNKLIAIKRIWNLYRKKEKLNIFYSAFCFSFYAINAVKRRI